MIPGPSGPLEALINLPAGQPRAAVVFAHPHPKQGGGGTMHTKAVYQGAKGLTRIGCAVLRFNFRGVGRSQGTFDSGVGELSDAAAVLDWMNTLYPNPSFVWVCGISFGAWIGMQLLMRRPEITGFISIAPPASMYDFAFLAPCPASGIMIHGSKDQVVPEADVLKLVERLRAQKGIKIEYHRIEGANHFFDKHEQDVVDAVREYSQRRMNDPNRGR